MYDYLIVGTGLFGAVFAHEATNKGKKCLVIDKRGHIGGNIYTEKISDVIVHKYGAHIFHTSNREVWEYMNRFAQFNHYVNSPVAVYEDKLYNLPFNMNTFYALWGTKTPAEARKRIDEQVLYEGITNPQNLEEQALSLVGRDIYEKLIKGYTEKQWGRPCKELPAFIIKRLPVRITYNNNYFNDPWQGIPIGGYTGIIEKLLEGSDIRLSTDYFQNRDELDACAKKVVYTGRIDEYYGYLYGALEYRSLRFETELLTINNYQGNAVVNYTEAEVPYTRIIEHKHFDFGEQLDTIITREYPDDWNLDKEPYYPVNDEKNNELYKKYRHLVNMEARVIFGGRLASYQYYDMDRVVGEALNICKEQLS